MMQKRNVACIVVGCVMILVVMVIVYVTGLHSKAPLTEEVRKETPFLLKRALERMALPDAERQERFAFDQKMRSVFPYDSWQWEYYRFGQASKCCERVVVGTVETAQGGIPPPPSTPNVVPGEGQWVVLSVDTNLYGKNTKKRLECAIPETVVTGTPIEQRMAKPGDRVLMFVADKWYDPLNVWNASPANALYFDFDRSKATWHKMDIHTLVVSHFILDDTETEQAAIEAAKGYLGFFGEKGKRDREKYYEFLCSLLSSPVKRIRDDAESDLILYFTNEKSADLDKLLADERIRKEVKDYLRYLLRNEKPTQS